MLREKKPDKDLKKHYWLLLEAGVILTLLIMLGAFTYNMGVDQKKQESTDMESKKQEIVQVKDVVRTKHAPNKPPQPASPQPPQEVPNDRIISENVQEQLSNIDQEISSGDKISLPPPPENEKDKIKEQIFKVVQKPPKIVGGLDSLRSLIQYPAMAKKAGIEGRVYVRFIVTKEGNVRDPKVIRGPGAGLNKEAVRVLKKAKFRPGIQQGHPVNVRMTMPVVFRLNKNY